MGLLDNFAAMPADDQQAWNSALMQMAGALLTPRSQGGGMGAAFTAFPAAMERAKAQSQKNEMFGLQKQQIESDIADRTARRAEEDRRRTELARFIAGLPPEQQSFAALAPQEFIKSLMKGPQVVSAGGALVGQDGKPIYQAPFKPEAPPELAKLIAARDALPPGHPNRTLFDQAIAKASTHAPGVNVNVGGQKDANWGTPPTNFVWARDAAGNVITETDPESGAYRPKAVPVAGGPAEKLPEGQQKQVIGVQNLQNAIKEYRDALSTFDTIDAIKPDARATMGTKYNNMMLQAKEAYNLGVLNGPDFQILTSVITDPRSAMGVITSKSALDTQASELSRIMGTIGSVASTPRPKIKNTPDRSAMEAEARRRGLIK